MINNINRCYGFLASLGFSSWSVEEVVHCLSDLGYSAVEWTQAHFNPNKSAQELSDLVRIPERYGLLVSEVIAQQDFVTLNQSEYRDRVEFSKACISTAARAGISVLNVFTGPAPWDPSALRLGNNISEGKSWELVLAAFSEIVPIAERYHVHLAVEAVYGHLCRDYYTLQELLRYFDSEYLAVNLDPSHFQLYGNDLPWVVQQLAPYIRHVHLKDAVGRPGQFGKDFIFPLLGEGAVNWSAFMSALDEINYQGALSVEFEAFNYYMQVLKDDPRRAAALSMEQINQLFPSVQKEK